MENSTKALYIVASTIIAILILSLVVFLFNRISYAQNEKDKLNEEQNITSINAEYEAFKKRLMYGADVISCINKAMSNNKEAEKNRDPDSYINVLVHLDTDAIEEFKIYKVVKGKNKTIDTNNDADKGNIISVFHANDTKKVRDLFKTNSQIMTSVGAGKNLGALFTLSASSWDDSEKVSVLEKNSNDKSNYEKYYYSLLDHGKIPTDESKNPLGCLVNTKEEYTWNFSKDGDSYCVKWTTAFKSFRTMAFSCTDIKYSDNNGRINTIVFEGRKKNK